MFLKALAKNGAKSNMAKLIDESKYRADPALAKALPD
jgi:hypothetical protein